MNINEVIQNAADREKSPLAKEIAKKLVRLGYEFNSYEPYSFSRGINVGESKAYQWVLEQLRKENNESD